MGYFGFDQLNIQYLEPPDDQHDDRCEALRWYWCSSCERPFMETNVYASGWESDNGDTMHSLQCPSRC